MRAFGEGKGEALPPGADADGGDATGRRVVSLKRAGARQQPAGDAPPPAEKRKREDAGANGGEAEEGDARKRGVRGRGAATYQSSVVAAVHEGPRREPPKADPTRVLKVRSYARPARIMLALCSQALRRGLGRSVLPLRRKFVCVPPVLGISSAHNAPGCAPQRSAA
jgi:hypothetical protein